MRISATVERKVRAAADELGYRPNLMARSLRTQVTHTVGLISDTVASDPFAGEMLRGAIAGAAERGHVVLIAETEGDADLEQQLVNEMLDRRVDGLIYASMFTREVRIPDAAADHPLVLANCLSDGHTSVIPDEYAAGRAAADLLLEAGHRDGIHMVGEPAPEVFAGRERVAGIEAALADAGTHLTGVVDCEWWPQPACLAVSEFLAGGGTPSAFVCMNDRVALGAYQALSDAGRRIGEEVSVLSFDDSDLAAWLRPALTSIALPHEEMGRTAIGLLLDGGDGAGVHRLPMPISSRESVGPPTSY